MDLSRKAVRFVIEALERQIAVRHRRLAANGLPDNEVADLPNDKRYLEAIIKDFEKYRDELVHCPAR
jgi:hypothetical protein